MSNKSEVSGSLQKTFLFLELQEWRSDAQEHTLNNISNKVIHIVIKILSLAPDEPMCKLKVYLYHHTLKIEAILGWWYKFLIDIICFENDELSLYWQELIWLYQIWQATWWWWTQNSSLAVIHLNIKSLKRIVICYYQVPKQYQILHSHHI